MKPGIVVLVVATLMLGGCGKGTNQSATNVPTSAPVSTPAARATATPDELAFARANYAKDCSACHGDQGAGGLVKVEDVDLQVPSLKEGRTLKHLDEDYVHQIEEGGDGMPKFKDKLSPAEINALVRFIRHEFQGRQ